MTSGLAFLFVALGGAIGAGLRHSVGTAVSARAGHGAYGTLAVNVIGSFLIGILAGLLAQGQTAWLLAATGILGAFTTVSSFSLQTLLLMREGRMVAALANIGGSLVLCLTATALGYGVAVALIGVLA